MRPRHDQAREAVHLRRAFVAPPLPAFIAAVAIAR